MIDQCSDDEVLTIRLAIATETLRFINNAKAPDGIKHPDSYLAGYMRSMAQNALFLITAEGE